MGNAVRDNPERVQFVGYDQHVVRYLAFCIAGFFAGITGEPQLTSKWRLPISLAQRNPASRALFDRRPQSPDSEQWIMFKKFLFLLDNVAQISLNLVLSFI